MVLNDRSLTNQKDGLSNSLNLTNQDFYVRLVDEKNKSKKASLQAVPSSPPKTFALLNFGHFPPLLPPATQATSIVVPLTAEHLTWSNGKIHCSHRRGAGSISGVGMQTFCIFVFNLGPGFS